MSHTAPLRSMIGVWLVLLLLLAATCASAYVSIGPWNGVINVSIAIVKTLLVMIFFMHLKTASGLTRIFAWAAFFWILVLIGLSLSDVLSR